MGFTTFQQERVTSRRGAAAVEFALIMPILTVLCLSTLEFGWYFAHKLDVINMASETMVYAASLDPNSVDTARAGTVHLHRAMKDYIEHSPGLKGANFHAARFAKSAI